MTAALLLAACADRTPEQTLAAEVEPVGSWLAAVQMAGERWQANSVPTRFVEDAVAAARQEIAAAQSAAVESKARAEVREPLRRLLADAGAACGRVEAALRDPGRSAMAGALPPLAALARRLESWKQVAEGEAAKP